VSTFNAGEDTISIQIQSRPTAAMRRARRPRRLLAGEVLVTLDDTRAWAGRRRADRVLQRARLGADMLDVYRLR
jgi:hypothetical protein